MMKKNQQNTSKIRFGKVHDHEDSKHFIEFTFIIVLEK